MRLVFTIEADVPLSEEEKAVALAVGVDVMQERVDSEVAATKLDVAAALGFPIEYMTKYGVTIVTEDIEGESV